jgi:hypothetical protein
LEETQTKIKLLIRDYVIGGKGFIQLDRAVQKEINEAIKDLESDNLKANARIGLNIFADRVYRQFVADLGFNHAILIGAISLMKKGQYTQKEVNILNDSIAKIQGHYEIGLPNQEFHKDYMARVKTALDNMRQIEAMDYRQGISLRNIAEMQVRYEFQQEKITNLKANGENLVVCSTHGNCSKRCEPWQGGHYTLDGTYQTVDGIKFVPLETATEIFVTTKSGKSYKNGLLGFNCRHYLIPYRKGVEVPNVNAKTIDREREIDQRMRQLERNVRQWKEERDLNNGVDQKRYLQARKKAIDWNKKYIQFAQENQRAYYPDRVKII